MRNTYLIDFENVGSEGLNGVASLTEEDHVILFFSANSNRMTVRAHQAIVASPAKFDYFEVAVGGKNALDHQLGTYLGYMVATNASERYFIVSHDNGFKFLSTFWLGQDPSLQISMSDNIKSSLRIRPSERPRPLGKPELKPEHRAEPTAPVTESKPVFELPVAETKPAAAAPVIEHKPVAAAPVIESKPVPAAENKPVVEAPAVENAPAIDTPLVESNPVIETPVVESKPELPAGPLPALGSQSRNRSNPQRGRVRSESILATLKQPKSAETPPAAPEHPAAETPKPENPQEDRPDAAQERPVALIVPSVAVPVGVASAEAPAAEPSEATKFPETNEAADTVEAAGDNALPVESEATVKSPRNRRRRTRSNRKEQKADETSAEVPAPEPLGDKVSIEVSRLEPKPETEQKKQPVQKPASEPKPHVLSDAASAALGTLLQGYPKINEARIRELIAGSRKQILCNTLRRQLGQEQGLALYNQIKKLAWK